jgi:hypothetical protein
MATPLNEQIMQDVLTLLIPSTVEHHDNYAADGVSWSDTYDYLMVWETSEGLTTDYVWEEIPDLADASRATVEQYARRAMFVVFALGETQARNIAESLTR